MTAPPTWSLPCYFKNCPESPEWQMTATKENSFGSSSTVIAYCAKHIGPAADEYRSRGFVVKTDRTEKGTTTPR